MEVALTRFGKHAGAYGLTAVLSIVTSSLMFPVYAAFFPAVQLGKLTTIQVVLNLVTPAARIGIVYGVFRFAGQHYAQMDLASTRRVAWTGLISTTALGVAVAVLLALGAVSLGREILGSNWVLGLELEAAALALSAPYDIALMFSRAVARPAQYAFLFSVKTLSAFVLSLFLIIGRGLGIYGIFWSDLVASSVTLLAVLVVLLPRLGPPQFSWSDTRRMIRFGVPLIPAQLGEWAVTFSDRLFLTGMTGVRQNGIYSLSYRLGSVEQQVGTGGLKTAWDPFALHHMKDSNAPRLLGFVATYLSLVAMTVAVILGVDAAPLLLAIHAKHGYNAAVPLVFVVALAGWFELMRYFFVTPASLRLRPEWATYVLFGTGLLNIGLNYPLIEAFGFAGAAWATLIAYAVGALMGTAVGGRLWKIDFEWYRLALILLAGTLSYRISIFITVPIPLEELALRTVCVLLLFVTLLALGRFWKAGELMIAREFATQRFRGETAAKVIPSRPDYTERRIRRDSRFAGRSLLDAPKAKNPSKGDGTLSSRMQAEKGTRTAGLAAELRKGRPESKEP